ncbi:MAG: WG repeat-containing protein [Salinivirgaceae bacterium]|nr:WG repeat-containing protein [Salinivirgaceae bacterium]
MEDFKLFNNGKRISETSSIIDSDDLRKLSFAVSRKGKELFLTNMSNGESVKCYSAIKCYGNVSFIGRDVSNSTFNSKNEDEEAVVDRILENQIFILRVDLISFETLTFEDEEDTEKETFQEERYTIFSKTGSVFVEKRTGYGVVDFNGNIIVPFGKYDWIDAFWRGLARVKIGQGVGTGYIPGNKWGIINAKGEEVVPVEYDEIWNFFGKDYPTIRLFNNNTKYQVYFSNPTKICPWRPTPKNHFSGSTSPSSRIDWQAETWDAMTDGMYGDMPEGFDGDFDWYR